MALGDLWNRTLVYFGIAEEDEWDDDTRRPRSSSGATRSGARTCAGSLRASASASYDDWTDSGAASTETRAAARACAASTRPRRAGPAPASVHLVVPRSFNDAQQIADKFKEAIPVILNLQSSDAELSKRLIDFASGLTYALEGGMQRVADKVFLLTPRNVEVSAEERARLLEGGGFFNQA